MGGKIDIGFDKKQMDDAFIDFLDEIAPNVRAIFDEVTADLMQHAQANWPVRQKNSKGSVDDFERGITVTSDSVSAYVRNTAPYAWAIKMGADSKDRSGTAIMLPLGKRMAQELLWSPAKKQTDKVAEALADDLAKRSAK